MSAESISVLTLTPDNPSNTTITSASGETLYTVVTEHSKTATTTHVRNAGNEVIASLEWRDVLPDKVTYGSNRPVSMGDWMKKSMVPFKDHLSFVDDKGRKYKWKGNSSGRSLELFSAEDDFSTPITRFHRSKRVLNKPSADVSASEVTLVSQPGVSWTPATLEFLPRALEIRDLAVTSFLFLEKSHRTNETASQNRADVLGTPAMSVGAGDYRIRDGGV